MAPAGERCRHRYTRAARVRVGGRATAGKERPVPFGPRRSSAATGVRATAASPHFFRFFHLIFASPPDASHSIRLPRPPSSVDPAAHCGGGEVGSGRGAVLLALHALCSPQTDGRLRPARRAFRQGRPAAAGSACRPAPAPALSLRLVAFFVISFVSAGEVRDGTRRGQSTGAPNGRLLRFPPAESIAASTGGRTPAGRPRPAAGAGRPAGAP